MLSIKFPLLPGNLPIEVNSIAIWCLVIILFYELQKQLQFKFKVKKYMFEDRRIAAALDITFLGMVADILSRVFVFELLNQVLFYVECITFILCVADCFSALFVNMSKHNYSDFISKTENDYTSIMIGIKSRRSMGAIGVLSCTLVFRFYLSFFHSSFSFIVLVALLIGIAITKTFYSKNNILIQQFIKEQVKRDENSSQHVKQ